MLFLMYVPNLLGHPDNYIEAIPLVTPAHIVPEWYFLPWYAVLRAIPDKLGGVIAMVSAIGIMALLPWLDTSKIRSSIYRPIWKQFTWFLVGDFFLLMYVGAMPAEGLWILLGRIGTGYWFAYFLILAPVVGWLEKPQLIPDAIHLRNKK